MSDGSGLRRRVAAVDVGSNSTRLLVLDHDGSDLVRVAEVTRLGRGVDANGRFDPDALERTLAAVDRYAATWEEHDVDPADVRIAATSAARDAEDQARFFDGIVERTGLEAEVLTGEEEAALSFLGATAGRADDGRAVLVVDIGGGSTELVAGRDGEVLASTSLQLGTVRLTERLLPDDPPSVEQVQVASREVHDRLDEAGEVLSALFEAAAADEASSTEDVRAVEVIGVAGTATTLAGMHVGIDEWVDGCVHDRRVPRSAVDDLASRLLALPADRRHEVGLLQAGREDVIAAGALILRAVLGRAGAPAMTTSERDILDGLAASLRP